MAIDLNSLLQTFGTTGNRPTAQDFINLIVFLYNNGGGSGGGNVDVSQFVGFAQPSDANVTPVPAHRIFINNQNAPVAYNGYKDANGNALTPPANSMGIFFHTGTAWSMFVYTVTKESVGLGNVDNTSDADKPVSIAVQDVVDILQRQIDTTLIPYINNSNVDVTLYEYLDAEGEPLIAPANSVNIIVPSLDGDIVSYSIITAKPEMIDTSGNLDFNAYTKPGRYVLNRSDLYAGNWQNDFYRLMKGIVLPDIKYFDVIKTPIGKSTDIAQIVYIQNDIQIIRYGSSISGFSHNTLWHQVGDGIFTNSILGGLKGAQSEIPEPTSFADLLLM
jgi:hypothetical protein